MNPFNRFLGVHPIPVLKFPVTRTGTYFNTTTNRYEFWFFMNGNAAKCGECARTESKPVIIMWRATTLAGLQDLVRQRIADGTLKVNPLITQNVPGLSSGSE